MTEFLLNYANARSRAIPRILRSKFEYAGGGRRERLDTKGNMAFANLSRDGVAVLMPDRNRLVMTVTAHYEKFPLSDVYVKAFQILRVVAR